LVVGSIQPLRELYFVLVKSAHERGYSVLIYDGPGQGSVPRDQGLTFTEWEEACRCGR
jgi:alpha-beta hydrolase superfamily lysophospholipase